MYNIVMSGNESKEIFYIIGNNRVIKPSRIIKQADEIISISDIAGTYDFIPGNGVSGNIFVADNIKKAENYIMKINAEAIKGLAFNYNRDESEIEQYKPDNIEVIIEENNNLE